MGKLVFKKVDHLEPLYDPIKAIYEGNFPPEERRDFEDLVAQFQAQQYTFYVTLQDDAVVAIAFVSTLEKARFAFLEYFAVRTNLHSQGVGSFTFQEMRQALAEDKDLAGLVWELELPNDNPDSQENKRIRFYQRLGAVYIPLKTQYYMPNYDPGATEPVPLDLMMVPLSQSAPLDVAKQITIISNIYENSYGEYLDFRDQIIRNLA